jgi:hypothetical protein
MHFVFQRFWHTSVRLDQDELMVDTTYSSTDKEICARMTVYPNSLIVRQAWLEIYRAPGVDSPRTAEISGLEGMEAYFDSGEALRKALMPASVPEAKDLFAEAVRGVIQAETFLVEQRGYANPLEYQDYWSEIYQGACRFYSNMDRVQTRWYDHIGYYNRTGSLFNRMKSQTMSLNNNVIMLAGHLHDSFHSVAVEMELDKRKGLIAEARGDILRAPDLVCMEATVYMDKLIGTSLADLAKKEIAFLLGGENGCVHLIDLVSDGAKTISLYRESENT